MTSGKFFCSKNGHVIYQTTSHNLYELLQTKLLKFVQIVNLFYPKKVKSVLGYVQIHINDDRGPRAQTLWDVYDWIHIHNQVSLTISSLDMGLDTAQVDFFAEGTWHFSLPYKTWLTWFCISFKVCLYSNTTFDLCPVTSCTSLSSIPISYIWVGAIAHKL